MLMFLQAVGEAVVAKGLGALKGFVPFGNVLFDVGADAIDRYRKANRHAKMAADAEALLKAEMKEVRAEAERIVRAVAAGESEEIIDLAVAYLTQMPDAIRQSLKRADDPTGTTIPATLNLQDPIQLSAVLPRRLPTFRTGDAVPHAPQWRFVELLGAGGFGEVWLAKHAYLDDLRAIKFCLDAASRNRLLTHEKDVVRRVMQASAAVSEVDHGIVRLLDCYLEADGPWLAYEYIDGGDLATWARANALLAPPVRAANAVNMVRDLAGVVGHFHALAQPVIHRDLKPANVLLKKVNGRWLLRVTDFGIGHVGAAAGLARATVSTPSMSLGDTFRGAHTPNYASPQQKRGDPADVRDDVHALGIIALQLLMGDLSAERPSGNSWKKKLKDCDLPAELLDLLARCWEDDPDERPKDGRELLAGLTPRNTPPVTPTPLVSVAVPEPTHLSDENLDWEYVSEEPANDEQSWDYVDEEPTTLNLVTTTPLTPDRLLATAKLHEGKELTTSKRGTIFKVYAHADRLEVIPKSSGKSKSVPRRELQRFCSRFNELRSTSPGDYQKVTHNATYLVELAVLACQ